MTSSPFSDLIRQLNRDGVTYFRMQAGCDSARSSAWFNNVANGVDVQPPPRDAIAKIAAMAGVSTAALSRMIAEEWYDVRPQRLSTRVKRVAPTLDALSEADAAEVEWLIDRLDRGTENDPQPDHRPARVVVRRRVTKS